jgi:DUF971 family protein
VAAAALSCIERETLSWPGRTSSAATVASIGDYRTIMSAWPTVLRLSKDRRILHVAFEDGSSYALAAELLRVESPSAEVQGHGPTQKKTVPGKREVEILKVEPVGHYAVKLTFDDMHDTGIYGWDYLRELGETGEAKMQFYLDELERQGLSRERKGRG